jgi:Bifunctional DNA primase/polymerase, N-terminal
MTTTMPRRSRGRRRAAGKMAAAAAGYAAMGWPVCAGAHPPGRPQRGAGATRGCSCDRMGCPAPGAHPMSPAWQVEATADAVVAEALWAARPDANVILATGRVFDVLDVPAPMGLAAMALMAQSGVQPGPVALSAGDRALFFVLTRGAPDDEQEWWSCRLDCEPETVSEVSALRWHCRDSYVLAPPSRFAASGSVGTARWLREPGSHPLPDGLRLLEFLADACEGDPR